MANADESEMTGFPSCLLHQSYVLCVGVSAAFAGPFQPREVGDRVPVHLLRGFTIPRVD